MEATQKNTFLRFSISSHRQDIIKIFKDIAEAFKNDVKIEEHLSKDDKKDIMDKYVGKFSGEFKDISSKKMFHNRSNKL